MKKFKAYNVTDVRIYGSYDIDGDIYATKLNSEMEYTSDGLFSSKIDLKTVTFNDDVDTRNVTNISSMFYNCFSLESVNFGKNFTTDKVERMAYMFHGCSSLKSLDLTNFNNAIAKNTYNGPLLMFGKCNNLSAIYVSRDKWSEDIRQDAGKNNMFSECGVSNVTYVD